MMGSSKQQTVPTSQQGPADYANPYLQLGFGAAQNAFTNPGPNTAAANTQLGSTIAGDYLNPASNPWLEQTFNTAADSTQNRLASEYAGAGRNVGASLPARSAELQGLAASIFGGNYQQERNRQFSAIGMAPSLENADLNQHLQSIMGLSSASSTGGSQQTMYQGSPWGSAAGGALSGAATGATVGSIFPGIGTAIGAVGGGLIGGIGGYLGG